MVNPRRFENKTALVTGAASGISKAIAIRLAYEGANIAIHDIDEVGAQETVKEIEDLGTKCKVYKVDIANCAQVKAAIAETIEDFKEINVLVCGAGVNSYKKMWEFTEEDWDWIIGVNLSGMWYYNRNVAMHMLELGKGSIVNVTSIAAFTASYMRIPYMASKGGAAALTKAFALELAESNIRVNAVAPACVKTNMTKPGVKRPGYCTDGMVKALFPMRRWGNPEELAAAAAFLASDDASYITGVNLICDGGSMCGNQIGAPWRPIPEQGEQVDWLEPVVAEYEY